MVEWEYGSFFRLLDPRAHLPATKFLESGRAFRSNCPPRGVLLQFKTVDARGRFMTLQSTARCFLQCITEEHPPAAAARSTEMLEMFPRGLISMEDAVPSRREKKGLEISTNIQGKTSGKVLIN